MRPEVVDKVAAELDESDRLQDQMRAVPEPTILRALAGQRLECDPLRGIDMVRAHA